MKKFGEIKKLKSKIGMLIDESPFKREFFQKRYKKTPNTISNWCTGKSKPSADELFDLAELLERKVDDFYERVGNDEDIGQN
jgi:transcriptional regulator with XRE-family HTH domain